MVEVRINELNLSLYKVLNEKIFLHSLHFKFFLKEKKKIPKSALSNRHFSEKLKRVPQHSPK